MNENEINQRHQANGATENRLTPAYIDSLMTTGQYHVFDGTTVTVCCITLKNGYSVVGQSACADPANFDEQIGREAAFNDAKRQVWALEGYALKERMAQDSLFGLANV